MSFINQYQPFGSARELLLSKSPEILVEGPAGTGKSRACLEKLHLCAMKYPGMRGLMCRKTRRSMTQSCMVTFETKVLTNTIDPYFHGQDQEYRYSNGSRIIVAGLNDPERIKSTEYDLVYLNEGTEATITEYEILTSRNRNGVMPYQQILVDANPDAPKHWLNQRASRFLNDNTPVMLRLKSVHEENPIITDEYLAILDRLTGVRYKRLRLGLWVASEGMVYEDAWDQNIHEIPAFIIPHSWRRFIVVDFGYTNPFVAQWWAQNPYDNTLFMYREIYKTQTIVQDHAHKMFDLSKRERIEVIITDHDAEDRATLSAHWHNVQDCKGEETSHSLVITTAADKEVSPGLEAVRVRLVEQSLFYFNDALVELDERLKDAGKPIKTTDEYDGYIWDETESSRMGIIKKDKPLKKDDHGMDGTRYMVKYIDSGKVQALKQITNSPPGKMTFNG